MNQYSSDSEPRQGSIENPYSAGSAGYIESDSQPRVSKTACLIGIVLSLLYLANLGAGLIEIPDFIPIIGNIDEAVATTVLVSCLSRFGIHLAPNLDPRKKK